MVCRWYAYGIEYITGNFDVTRHRYQEYTICDIVNLMNLEDHFDEMPKT